MKIYEQALDKFYQWLSTSGIRIVFGILLLWIGFRAIRKTLSILNKILEKRNVDITLSSFLDGFIKICLQILLILIIMNYVGISTSGVLAFLGSAGIAIGLAVRDSLANFAGGVIILFMRPFNVGDYIEGAEQSGKVGRIGMFYTHMNTVDNKEILIPNGILANGVITNYTAQEMRRVDHTFSVGYEQDIRVVKNILLNIINQNELILHDPEPFVAVSELGDNSVNFIIRAWTKTDDYWTVYYDLIEKVKIRFDEENVSIPYPQMDVHLKEVKKI